MSPSGLKLYDVVKFPPTTPRTVPRQRVGKGRRSTGLRGLCPSAAAAHPPKGGSARKGPLRVKRGRE